MIPGLAPPLPVTLALRPPGGSVLASLPAGRPLVPGRTARQLYQQLRERGVTGMYVFALPQLAVVSLPTLTIWITSHTLTWTQGILKITWPAGDTAGAADHLAQLAKRPHAPATASQPQDVTYGHA
jgi:hypothetical protein